MQTLDELRQIATLMAGYNAPWYAAGGWALDLFLGRVTRPHHDSDIAVLRKDQALLRQHFAGWELRKALSHIRGQTEPWTEGEWLELAYHELHALDPANNPPELEILLNEVLDGRWVFRRNPTITRAADLLGQHSPTGLPYLSPEIVLLYKASSDRSTDDADFYAVVHFLAEEPCIWLRHALTTCYPAHPWLAALALVAEVSEHEPSD